MDIKNSINFKNIYEWPLYGRLVVFLLVSLGVFYFGYYFDFSSFSNQIYGKYQQEKDLKQQMKAILKNEAEMHEVVSSFHEIEKLLDQWQGQLINGAHLPDLLNQILKLGTANHLQFSLFVPGDKQKKDDYFEVPIKIVMQGGYNQVANFISQVANLPEIVAIGDFVISKPTSALTLEVYYLANKK